MTSKKLYTNDQWQDFAAKVKHRDCHQCLQCKRSESEVTLQVHHELYIQDKPPWEYALSDCRTLCKGCHAKEHQLQEPSHGWSLVSIQDLGGLDGVCEREHCGHEIRYAHVAYHPSCGYKTVGSTCIEILTQEDRLLSNRFVTLYKKISQFVHGSDWQVGVTKKGKKYISSTYKHHSVRIYGGENRYSLQTVLKLKGVRWHEYGELISVHDKNLEEAKELAYIVLKGQSSKDREEKSLLRQVYKKIK